MDFVLLLLVLSGHLFLWVAIHNRLHSTNISQAACKQVRHLCIACLGLIAAGYAYWFAARGWTVLDPGGGFAVPWKLLAYLVVCWTVAVATCVWWACWRLFHRPPAVQRYYRTRLVDLSGPSAPQSPEEKDHHFLTRIPGNQVLQLDLAERALALPRLPDALDGLTIVQLSDFHFTGRIGKAYFQEVVRLSNELHPDLVAVTGDIVDDSEFIDWIPQTLGNLTSRFGNYFVLGNHDALADVPRLRRTLRDSGLVDLGGRWVECRIRSETVILAGNEMPWFPPAADMQNAPPRTPQGGPLRIALAHTPDQLGWARQNDFDLLLAGHTHGGQIRIPLIGPVINPTRVGVKYASGIFHHSPTVIHVTRGLSGEYPIRMNCPPEMAKLVLHTPNRSKDCRSPS